MKQIMWLFGVVALISLLAASPLQAQPAQPIQETQSALQVQNEIIRMPVSISSNQAIISSGEVNSEDANLLNQVSELLNQDVAAKAGSGFEALRRHSIFQVEQTLVSQFTAFDTSRRSS